MKNPLTDRDEIIARIEKLPILQQIQLNLLVHMEICSMLHENRQKEQEELGTNISPEILEDIYQLHYRQVFSEYHKFVSQLTGNLLETLLSPFEQLQLMGELAQAVQQDEQFKNLRILNQHFTHLLSLAITAIFAIYLLAVLPNYLDWIAFTALFLLVCNACYVQGIYNGLSQISDNDI